MSILLRKFQRFKKIFPNKEEKDFIRMNPLNYKKKNGEKIVLIEMTENIYFIVNLYFLLKNKIFENKKIIGLWSWPIHRKKGFKALLSFLFDYFINYFIKLKWIKIYKHLGIYQVIDFNNNFRDNMFVGKSNFIENNSKLKNKKSVLNIRLEGIRIGDLIYDHYLRFFGDVTFDLKNTLINKRLLTIFEGSNNNLNNFYNKHKKQIEYYIPQSAVYLNGLAIRYFINKNIKTIGGVRTDSYVSKFTKQNFLESRRCQTVKQDFKKIKNKSKKINFTKENLKKKFQGKKNKESYYLKHSPYNKKKLFKIKKNFDVIIFLPDFSDAPHAYGNFVFDDFFHWIHETLEFLKLNNLTVAIKEHPNAWIYSSTLFLKELKIKYKKLVWLSKHISNKAIFNKKPKFGISPHGTVLHELAYHKIIPIAAGPNPYMSYNFVFTPKNKKDYFSLIMRAAQKKLRLKKNFKKEIAECYYMYFLNNNDCLKTQARNANIKDYLPSVGGKGVYDILKRFNEGFFSK